MQPAPILVTLLALTPVCADVIHQDITLDLQGGMIVFATAQIELGIDAETGVWRQLRDPVTGRVLMSGPPETPRPTGGHEHRWLLGEAQGPTRYAGHRARRDGDAVVLEVDQDMPGWRATASYHLWPGRAALKRDVALTPTDGAPRTARNVRFLLDGLRVGDTADTRYSILANWPPHRTAFADLQPGREVGESFSGATGRFVMVHSEQAQVGVVAALVPETESAGMRVLEQDGAVRVDHMVWTQFPPRPGETEQFGSQLLCIARGDWRDALRQGRDLYDLIGLAPPADMLDEARRTVFYSAHPGGSIDSGFNDVGGLAELARYLPELERLGVNVLWLLPFWKGNIYSPVDYFALDPRYGTEEQFRALVQQAHGLGIKALGDLIPHGPRDESSLHLEHRDWVSSNEDGSLRYWWGCLSCDYAHPGWQDYMGRHAAYWVERVGLDGYRVDCAGGGPPNWTPFGDNRPTMSGLHGGLEVLRVTRERMQQVKDRVLLLAEAAGPALLRHSDYYYDWPLCWHVLKEFPLWRTDEFVPRLAQWLESEQYWLPKDANLIHFLENHDSVRARLVHGPGPERALMALCALIPGSPLVYHFQEEGLAPYLARLYEVRRELPELTRGEADFLSVECSSPEVLVFTRAHGGDRSLIAINFSGRPQAVSLHVPEALGPVPEGPVEVLRGLAVGRVSPAQLDLRLPPYETALIVGADRGVIPPTPEPRPQRTGRAEFTVTETDEGLLVETPDLALVIGRDNGGLIKRLTTPDGATVLRSLGLEEGRRRLWLGGERMALGDGPPVNLTWRRSEDARQVVVWARGRLTRRVGDQSRPVADYTITHQVVARDEPEIGVNYAFIIREPIRNVLGSLYETLALDPDADEWAVCTREGFLHDWAVARRPRDVRYVARQWRGVGDRVWQSRDHPLALAHPFFGARSEGAGWTLLQVDATEKDDLPRNVMLKMRHGEAAGPHVRFEWLDGQRAVNVAAGETLAFGYKVRLSAARADDLRALSESLRGDGAPVSVRIRGSRYELSNGRYQLAVTRHGGGRIADLRFLGDPEPLIRESYVYSDGGIFGDRTLPSMERVRNFVSSNQDAEAELRLTHGDPTVVTVEGFLRDHDGLGLPSPRTRYRVTYEMDATDTLRVAVAVRVPADIPQAEAFLAQTLHLSRMHSFEINARDGLARATPGPRGERVWESKREGFGEDPWMLIRTGTGRALRIAGPDLATALQNAFLHRSGGDAGVVFLAFNDFEPADITPVWREARYAITLLREAER